MNQLVINIIILFFLCTCEVKKNECNIDSEECTDSSIVSSKKTNTVVTYYEKSKALNYLDFTNDSTLFNSFVGKIDSINAPVFLPPTQTNISDSLAFIISNTRGNLSNRTIAASSVLKNELTPLFKFFRKIKCKHQTTPFSIFDTVSFNDSSISVSYKINILQQNKLSFVLIQLKSAVTNEGMGNSYLCTFSKSGFFIDGIYCPVFENGYNCSFSKCSIDDNNRITIKGCDYLPTENENEMKEKCSLLTYKLKNDGCFYLSRDRNTTSRVNVNTILCN